MGLGALVQKQDQDQIHVSYYESQCEVTTHHLTALVSHRDKMVPDTDLAWDGVGGELTCPTPFCPLTSGCH